ncbi:hypothetical protein ABPG77_007837 [Micractinium sp. CCAP 211/92]
MTGQHLRRPTSSVPSPPLWRMRPRQQPCLSGLVDQACQPQASPGSKNGVPCAPARCAGNTSPANEHFRLLVDYVKHQHPYWNATNGADHFFVSDAFHFVLPCHAMLCHAMPCHAHKRPPLEVCFSPHRLLSCLGVLAACSGPSPTAGLATCRKRRRMP